MPNNVKSVIEQAGFIPIDQMEDEVAELYEPGHEGYCMTCRAQLGEQTLLVVGTHGIVAVYCGGACLLDQANMQWLQEQWDDIRQKVEFRGGTEGDEPDATSPD